MDLAIPADHRDKLKESENRDKYQELARELKKLWNMKVTLIPIVSGAFGTIPKGLVKGLEDLEIRGQVETIQITVLLRSARILRRVLETCCNSNSCKKLSANAGVKNSQRSKITIIMMITIIINIITTTIIIPVIAIINLITSIIINITIKISLKLQQ